jgi:hypothetical protein
MNKMAIFVEGYSELLFADKLVQEIANRNSVQIGWRQVRGGTTTRRTSREIKAAGPNAGQEHFVLILDCGGETAVKSRMLQEYANLASAGYSRIVCLRDVRPTFTHATIPLLEASLPKYVKTKPIQVSFILAIMEIEAWFLSEHTHFARIDPNITPARILAALGFDPEREDMQQRLMPALDIQNVYSLEGKSYTKGSDITVNALDYVHVYTTVADRLPYLRKLCDTIDAFLGTN